MPKRARSKRSAAALTGIKENMDNFDKALNGIMDFLAIESVQSAPCPSSPFGKGVGEVLDKFASLAKSMGFTVHNEGGYYVTADIGSGKPFAILGHLDTVPLGEGWDHSPLGEIAGGTVYGRGILDDKGPLLLCLYAAAQLVSEGYVPCRKIRFFAGGNEESGWKCAERYSQLDKWPEEGFSPDADFPVIACEKGVLHVRLTLPLPGRVISIRGGGRVNVVMDMCRAVCDTPVHAKDVTCVPCDGGYAVTAHGRPAHGSTPWLGDNAARKVLSALREISPAAGELSKALCAIDGSGIDCALSDKESGALTCNLGVLSSDENNLYAELDIRYPVTFTAEEIVRRIGGKLSCPVEITGEHLPHSVDVDSPLVRGLLGAYNDVTGRADAPLTVGGATYARVAPGLVAFGPCFPGDEPTIHQRNERADIASLRKIYDIYLLALKRLCFKKREMC